MTADRFFTLTWLLGLLLLGHFLFFVGYMVSDDSLYVAQAQRFLNGDLSPPSTHWGFRYSVVLPTVLLGWIGNYSDQLLALIPLFYWICLVCAVYWFTVRTTGKPQALIASLLIVTLPLLVVQSSILGVDITEAFFLFTALAVFYQAETSPNPPWGRYLICGVLVGLAMLTRETAYGFLLVLGVFFLQGGYRRWPLYLVGLGGVLAVLSLEWLYYLSYDQSILYRLETITQSHGSIGIKSGDFASGSGNISDSRIFGPVLALLFNQEFAFLFWAALAASVYTWRHGDTEHKQLVRYITTAFVVYFLWIGYAGAVRPLPRYFSFVAVLATIPVALMIIAINRNWLRYCILILLLGGNIAALSVENIHPRFASRSVSQFAIENRVTVMTVELNANQARQYTRFMGADDKDIVSDAPQSGTFVYALIEGKQPPLSIAEQIVEANLVAENIPPKLLIGHILDITGLGRLLTDDLYHYLAIRNPVVHFYQISKLK